MHSALIRRQRRQKRRGGHIALRFALVGLAMIPVSLILLAFMGALGVYGVYAAYVSELPSAEEIGRRSVDTFETTRLYDRTGQHVLYELIPDTGGRRTEVPLSRIPVHLRNATIAMEDKTFYTNPVGVNVEGLARAFWGVVTGDYAGGGSSIPQQLIRNVIMTPEERMERSYSRKVREIILSFELTRRYPGVEGRDQILEWYLNNIFYGYFAYGVEAAAQTYFGKHVEDLTLAEMAMLVPLGQSPALNPIDYPEEAKKRQEIVLDQMYLQGYITAEEAYAAKQQTLVIASPDFDITAPHFSLYVRDELVKRYGHEAVYGGGLQVITSIDLEVQAEAERLAREQIATQGEAYQMSNAAVVVLDAKRAEILAMVGSIDYYNQSIDGQVNMAVSPRQPGSSFKPFTYATAFAQGYSPATVLLDVRTTFPNPPHEDYVPENYSKTFHGPVSIRRALGCSYNIPAVLMMQKVGIQNVIDTAHAMGISTLNDGPYGPSLTLGAAEVPLIDMVYAFSVFDNGGVMLGEPVLEEDAREGFRRLNPVSILKVTDARGNVLYEYQEPERQQVIQPEVAYLITHILSDNNARTPAFGAVNALVLRDRPVAAKTGTTNDFYDGWTVGYTPQYAVGVWVGNTNHTEMDDAEAARTAAPIWNKMMEWLHQGLPVETWARPAGVVTAVVDAASGKLPTQYSGAKVEELFIEGMVPTEYDDVHQPFRMCKVSGKLATAYCPPEETEEQVIAIYPPEAGDWIREHEASQPPREYCDVHGPNLAEIDVAVASPRTMQAVRGVVTITGNARNGDLQRYWLEVTPGLDTSEWTRIGGEHAERVEGGQLEVWDTAGLNGLYTLRLSVQTGGGLTQVTVPVMVDNTPPSVSLKTPTAGQTITASNDGFSIQASAEDNVSINRVEFFLDEQSVGVTTVGPYSVQVPMPGPGAHALYAVAYDSAGNEVRSETIQVSVGG